jgi:hypothetical protein
MIFPSIPPNFFERTIVGDFGRHEVFVRNLVNSIVARVNIVLKSEALKAQAGRWA